MKEFIPQKLPLKIDLETKEILKKVISANRELAMLNGISKIIPNQNILINSLVLQEAKDSSAIENIITTHDEVYQGAIDINTGRIINILYLVQKELLDLPILYLSRYIIQNKSGYYQVLQGVQNSSDWNALILYMLDGVEQTAKETSLLIENIQKLMIDTKQQIKEKLPKVYSKDLIEILFSHPYTKIDFLVDGLGITRQTASKYLKELETIDIVESIQIKNSKFFVNRELFAMLRKGA